MDIQGDHLLSRHRAATWLPRSSKAIVYRERDGIVKRAHPLGRRSTHGPEPARQELAAVAQPLAVDAVADPGGEMPLGRHPERGKPLGRLKQCLRRDEVIAIA